MAHYGVIKDLKDVMVHVLLIGSFLQEFPVILEQMLQNNYSLLAVVGGSLTDG